MDSSSWTRIKRGKALIGVTQPNTSGDVLMERKFVSGPILFNGKVVSECCTTSIIYGPPETIYIDSIQGSVIQFSMIDGDGTVDFGNGTIIPIANIDTNISYTVGPRIIIKSATITTLNINNAIGATNIIFNEGLTYFTNFTIQPSTVANIDITNITKTLQTFQCVDCMNLTNIIGLNNCPSLINMIVNQCNIRGIFSLNNCPLLQNLAIGANTGITSAVFNKCPILSNIIYGFCNISQSEADNVIIPNIIANGVSGGSLNILTQGIPPNTVSLDPSTWTALGNDTGSTGLGWTII